MSTGSSKPKERIVGCREMHPPEGRCVLCLPSVWDGDLCTQNIGDNCAEIKRGGTTTKRCKDEHFILCECDVVIRVGREQTFTLYHTTDAEAAASIKKSKILLPGKGGIFGSGIYLAPTKQSAQAKGLESAGKAGATIDHIVTVRVTGTPAILPSFAERPQEAKDQEHTGNAKKVQAFWENWLKQHHANILDVTSTASIYHFDDAKGEEFVVYDADAVHLEVVDVAVGERGKKGKRFRKKALQEYMDYYDYNDYEASQIGYGDYYVNNGNNESEYIIISVLIAFILCAVCSFIAFVIGCYGGYRIANKRKNENYQNI